MRVGTAPLGHRLNSDIRTKLIDDAKRPDPRYRGLVHGTVSIVREEGIGGIYRGLFPVVSFSSLPRPYSPLTVHTDDAAR